jgi:hypothetical protein
VREQVRHIGTALGRDIPVEVVTAEQARVDMRKTLPPMVVDGIMAGWEAGIDRPQPVSTVVEEVTGAPARTFAQWADDHAADFR